MMLISEFIIHDITRVMIQVEDESPDIYSCDLVLIELMLKDERYVLSYDYIGFELTKFRDSLIKCLGGKLYLHSSIKNNLGYLWNEKFNENTHEVFYDENYKVGGHWVGTRYLVWCSPGEVMPNMTTWLYNVSEDKIIFEVTENYFWNGLDPEPGKTFIEYDAFIRDYKPLLKIEVSKEKAQNWVNQINLLLERILSCDGKRLHHEEKFLGNEE